MGITGDFASRVQSLKAAFPAKPRGRIFRSRRRAYFYDANSGEIFGLDGISEKVLRALGTPSLDSAAAEAAAEHGESAVVTVLDEIIRRSGGGRPPLFSWQGPETIGHHLDFDTYRNLVLTRLSQLCLSVTDACNLACRYCCYSGRYPHRQPHGNHVMSEEVLDRAVDHLIEHSREIEDESRALSFYGGESLLVFDLVRRAVERIKTKAPGLTVRFGVSTNLTVLRPEMIEFLHRHNFTLYVSLDGPKAVHDRYRVKPDGSGSHDLIMENLRKIWRYDRGYYERAVHFNCVTAPPFSYREILDFFAGDELFNNPQKMIRLNGVESPEICFEDECRDPGFLDAVELTELHSDYVRRVKDGSIREPSFRNKLLREMYDKPYLRIYRRTCLDRPLPAKFSPGGICVPGQRKIYVRWDGTYFPCERIPEFEVFRLGSVFTGVDPEKGYRLCLEFKQAVAEDCRKCWAFLMCDLCFRDSYRDDKLDLDMRRAACERTRGKKLAMLANMCDILEDNPHGLEFLNEYSVK